MIEALAVLDPLLLCRCFCKIVLLLDSSIVADYAPNLPCNRPISEAEVDVILRLSLAIALQQQPALVTQN